MQISRSFLMTIFLITAALVIISCDDDDGPANYFLHFKVDGNLVEYSQDDILAANFSQVGPQYVAIITGFDFASNVSVQVYDEQPISEKIYANEGDTSQVFVGALISYSDSTGTLYTQGEGDTDVMINISMLSSDELRGSFSGTLEAEMQSDISVTEGEFFLKRSN